MVNSHFGSRSLPTPFLSLRYLPAMQTKIALLIQRKLSSVLINFQFTLTRLKYSLLGLDAHATVSIYSTVKIYHPYEVSIGKEASIGDYCVLWGGGGIEIGSSTMISTNCAIVSQSHQSKAVALGLEYRDTLVSQRIRIGSNVWIGANVILLPGVSIGDNAIIGAGSVVTHDIPPDVVAYGSPALVKRDLIRPA